MSYERYERMGKRAAELEAEVERWWRAPSVICGRKSTRRVLSGWSVSSPFSVAYAFNSTALSASSATRASLSSPGSRCCCARLVGGEASRCVIHFFEPLLGAPTREKFKRELTTTATSETHSRQWNADDPTNRAFR
jgi:hypothetical protein